MRGKLLNYEPGSVLGVVLLALASTVLGGCGREPEVQAPSTVHILERGLVDYVHRVRAGLVGLERSAWIDVYYRKRLLASNTSSECGHDAWLAGVLQRIRSEGAGPAELASVAASIAASDVLVVTDIHSCRLHQAAYWALVSAVEEYSERAGVRVIYNVEGLSGELLDASGHVLAERPALPTGWPVEISVRELEKRWRPASEFLPWPESQFEVMLAAASVADLVGAAPFDWMRVSRREVGVVNGQVAMAIRSKVTGHPPTKVCVLVGYGHPHERRVPLVGALREAGLKVAVVHPYAPELVADQDIQHFVFNRAWVEIGEDEFVAPLPYGVGVVLGILPEN